MITIDIVGTNSVFANHFLMYYMKSSIMEQQLKDCRIMNGYIRVSFSASIKLISLS